MRRSTLVICCLLFTLSGVDSSIGQISGFVGDRATGQALAGANVAVSPGDYGTATDMNGQFHLSGIPDGTYEIKVRFIGYEEEIVTRLTVAGGHSRRLHVELVPTVLELEEVAVTGKRGRALTWELPISAEVISAKDMERANAVSVGDAIGPTAGAFVKRYGHLSAIQSLSVRGSSSEQVLIMWDGARLNSPLAGGFDLSILPLNALGRIEFVRGGLSSLFGADAAAGVLNLITKLPSADGRPDGSITTTFGSLGSLFYQAQASQRVGSFSYFLSGTKYRSDGDFAYEAADPVTSEKITKRRENADFNLQEAFGKVSWHASGVTSLTVSGEWSETKRGAPGSLTFPSPEARQVDETTRLQVGLTTLPSAALRIQTQSFFNALTTRFWDPDPSWPQDAENKGTAIGSSLQCDLFLDANTVTIGGNYLIEKSKGTSVGNQSRNSLAIFAQDEFVWREILGQPRSSLTLLPSVRLDKYSDFDQVISPKIGILLSRQGQRRAAIRANIGRSFRAPTFNDLHWPEDAFTKGNPELEPERVINIEAGLLFGLPAPIGVSGEVNYFSKKAKDLIIWGMDSETFKWSPDNISEAEISGQEVILKWMPPWSDVIVEANYTHLKAVNRSGQEGLDGKRLIYRPDHSASIRFGFRIGPASFNILEHYVGARYADEANANRLPDCITADANLGVSYRLLGMVWKARAEVDNIFDKSYQVVDDYPMPGRLWRVTVGLDL